MRYILCVFGVLFALSGSLNEEHIRAELGMAIYRAFCQITENTHLVTTKVESDDGSVTYYIIGYEFREQKDINVVATQDCHGITSTLGQIIHWDSFQSSFLYFDYDIQIANNGFRVILQYDLSLSRFMPLRITYDYSGGLSFPSLLCHEDNENPEIIFIPYAEPPYDYVKREGNP